MTTTYTRDDLLQCTKKELLELGKVENVSGRHDMTKEVLVNALATIYAARGQEAAGKIGGRMKNYVYTGKEIEGKVSPQLRALVETAATFGDQPFNLRQLGYRAVEQGRLRTDREPYHLAHKNKVELLERGYMDHASADEREHRRFMAHRMIEVRQQVVH